MVGEKFQILALCRVAAAARRRAHRKEAIAAFAAGPAVAVAARLQRLK